MAKLKPAGDALVYAGYLGGQSGDVSNDIAVDGAGNAYITGTAYSTESSFPVTVGPDLTHNDASLGSGDAFVAKVNPGGSGLDYAGYIGGAMTDDGAGIALDSADNAYVTGITRSPETTFPVATGPDLTFNGASDAFVAKVAVTGAGLVYAGYIGGSDCDAGGAAQGLCGGDTGIGIAVDSAGHAYVTGSTAATHASFPVLVGPDLTFNGVTDAFVAKVNPAGTALVYAGFIGGGAPDPAYAIDVDRLGNAVVTGSTSSSHKGFPVKDGPKLTYNQGDVLGDAFVAKVNAAGTGLVFAGYIGGSGGDAGNGVAVDDAGNAYVAGERDSLSLGRAQTRSFDGTSNGGTDAFIVKVGASTR